MQISRRGLLVAGLSGLAGLTQTGCDLGEGFSAGFGAVAVASGYSGPVRSVADPAWRALGWRAEGVKVAVIDAGFGGLRRQAGTAGLRIGGMASFVEAGEVDLLADPAQHGTEMCAAIGGEDGDRQTGLATLATFYLAKGEDEREEPRLDEARVIRALDWALEQGVDLINISLGFSTFDDGAPYAPSDMTGQTTALSRALQQRLEQDPRLIAVVSAGNLGASPWGVVSFPGDVEAALTVGSVEGDLRTRRRTSGRGPAEVPFIKPDLCVPSGRGASSVATAVVCGLAACLRGAFPAATRQDICDALRASASNAAAPDRNIGHGTPRASVAAARLQRLPA